MCDTQSNVNGGVLPVLSQAPPLEIMCRGRDIPQASLTSNEGCSKERELGKERRKSN